MTVHQIEAELPKLLRDMDEKIAEVYEIVRKASEMGVHVPDSVFTRKQSATEWWKFRSEQILARQRKTEARGAALAKLTPKERKVLGL